MKSGPGSRLNKADSAMKRFHLTMHDSSFPSGGGSKFKP